MHDHINTWFCLPLLLFFPPHAITLFCMPTFCLCISRDRETLWVWTLSPFIKRLICFFFHEILPFYLFFSPLPSIHPPCTSSVCLCSLHQSPQSPTRAVLLKMAVQRGGGSPRPGSACILKRSPLVEAELCEARSSSACSYPLPLPNKLAGKVNERGKEKGLCLTLRSWADWACGICLIQERVYRSPEKRSSLPRPAKSLTRHIPAAEQEDNSTPSRPTCKIYTHFSAFLQCKFLFWSFLFCYFFPPRSLSTFLSFCLPPLKAIRTDPRGDGRSGRAPSMAGRPPGSSR